MIRPRRNWTAEEDDILKREVRRGQAEGDNISWHEIATFLPGRTNKDCRKRWYGTAAAKVKKGPWTEAEDERLRRAIERHGTKWAVVASVVATRLPDQCSKRWSHAINPNINHSPWTEEEDELLIQSVNKHGHSWQQIVSRYFTGRTSLAAKNRYHILQRRLKSEEAGVTDRLYGLEPMGLSPWQEMLWPERTHQSCLDSFDTTGSSTHGLSSSSSNETTHLAGQNSTGLAFEQGRFTWPPSSHSPLYHRPAELDIESTALPIPRSATTENSGMCFDFDFPSGITVDDLVPQALSPATTSVTTPSLSSVLSSDTNSTPETKAQSTQRRVCIQAVCSTDKLGAMFEAVTKFSISAVIKTDD